jgi:S-adenosylmethionine hydrolase
VGPDNGLFTSVLRYAELEIVTLPTNPDAAPTFHGRDLFAPAAARLAAGAALRSLGDPFPGIPQRLVCHQPHYQGKSVVGEVVYVDRFGTLVTSLTPTWCPTTPWSRWRDSRSAR